MDWKTEIVKRGGLCAICGAPVDHNGTPQLAHRIAKTKTNYKKYGTFFIDHSLNLVPVCSLACNQICNIGFNNGEILKLLSDILIFEIKRFR